MAVRIFKNWDGSLAIGKNDSGYYSFDEVLEFFNIGPAKMEYYLKEYKDVIVPIYNNNDSDILNSKYHWIEVKELNDIIMKKHKDEKYWEKFCKSHLDDSTDSPQEYDTMKARIVELEAELASLKDDNVRLMAEVEAVKPWGIWKTILDMRNEGKTATEVAQYLFDHGITNDRIFLLLYPDEVIDGITDKTQYGVNLRAGKTKKLPW